MMEPSIIYVADPAITLGQDVQLRWIALRRRKRMARTLEQTTAAA